MVRKGVVRKGGPSDGLHEDWLFNPSIHVQSPISSSLRVDSGNQLQGLVDVAEVEHVSSVGSGSRVSLLIFFSSCFGGLAWLPIGGLTFPDNTFPDRISVDLGSVLDWFGTGLGSIRGRFGIVLGSVWGLLSNGFRGFCNLGNDLVRKGVVRKGGPSDGLHEVDSLGCL